METNDDAGLQRPVKGRAKAPRPSETCAMLRAAYRDEIMRSARLVDRDLGSWLG